MPWIRYKSQSTRVQLSHSWYSNFSRELSESSAFNTTSVSPCGLGIMGVPGPGGPVEPGGP